MRAPAYCGLAKLEGRRTREEWERYAKRLAKQAHRRDGIPWTPVVAWIEHRNAYRISLAYQEDRGTA